MGRLCLEELSGDVWVCNTCNTHLAYDKWILSTDYHSSTGPAILFASAVNTTKGLPKRSHLRSGVYVICDLHCIGCDQRLGWHYNEAAADDQKYKEERVVLERAAVVVMKDVR